jgi:hypothetical protein
MLKVLAGARERAIEYKNTLPKLICVDTKQHYTSKVARDPEWKVNNTL